MSICEKCKKRSRCTKICDKLEQKLEKSTEKYENKVTFLPREKIDTLQPYTQDQNSYQSFPDQRETNYDYWDIKLAQEKYGFRKSVFNQLFTFYIEGRTQQETAKICGCSQPNVSKHLKKYPIRL